MQKKFKAKIIPTDNGGAYVEVPFDVEKVFGSKKPKIKAVFEGKEEYRGTLVRMQTECHLLLILKDIRKKLGKEPGDTINVVVSLDSEPRVVDIPDELEKALKRNPSALEFFESMSYTCRKEYAGYVSEAKKEETRIKRVEKVIELLNLKKKNIR